MASIIRPVGVLLLAAGVTLAACSNSSMTPATPVPVGDWGGNHAAMTVTDSGATLQFDCAHGAIPQSLTVDSSGHFDAAGTYTQEGGPTPIAQTPVAARYSGTLRGTTELDLAVTTAANQTMNGLSLEFGVAPTLVRCF